MRLKNGIFFGTNCTYSTLALYKTPSLDDSGCMALFFKNIFLQKMDKSQRECLRVYGGILLL